MRPTDVDEVRLEAILHKLSQSQRADLLAGASMWETVAVPRANVPAIRVTDGPNGARGSGSFAGGLSAACFPAGISLGSTWNPALVARVGSGQGRGAGHHAGGEDEAGDRGQGGAGVLHVRLLGWGLPRGRQRVSPITVLP